VAEKLKAFEAKVKELNNDLEDAKKNIDSLNAEMSNMTVSEEQVTEAVVKKVVAVLEDGLGTMSHMEMEQEYLYRKKANITFAQFREYSRWNRIIKKQRSYQGRFYFTVHGKEYSIRKTTVETKNDAKTRLRLLQAMYAQDFPKAERLQTEEEVDGVVVDSAEKAMKARLRLVLQLRSTIKAKRFHHFNGRLLYAINWDGAPFNKTGALTNQSVLLATCLNEGFTTTLESLIFLGVISSSEDSEESKQLCRNIDRKLQAFKKSVEEDGLMIGNLKFRSVEYVLCCDMKASNKLQGAAPHAATFFSTTHVGLKKDSVGYGVNGRAKTEESLFKDYNRKGAERSKTWKEGELPVPLTPALVTKLKRDVTVAMQRGRHGSVEGLTGKALHKWTDKAKAFAKNKGHAFYLPEFFPETQFVTSTYCALHYKTVKVLDFLDFSCMALMNYDRYCGRLEAIGASLSCFINSLENDECMKSQLKTYANDARLFWLKLDLKKTLCHSGTQLKRLNKLVDKEIKVSRLLGRQANIPLSMLDKMAELLNKARETGNYNRRNSVSKKTEEEVNKDMDQVVSSLLAMLLAIRNITYWMGRSGLEIYELDEDATEEEYKKYVEHCNTELKKAAMEIEIIQSSLFPEYVRPYDVCATYSMPHISDILAELGILHGRAGLLECYESFHKYYHNLSAYKSATGSAGNKSRTSKTPNAPRSESRNMYKFSTMWLIYGFLPMQPYGLAKEVRSSNGWKFRSRIIPKDRYPFFDKVHSRLGCF
jgi:hypothetical protein